MLFRLISRLVQSLRLLLQILREWSSRRESLKSDIWRSALTTSRSSAAMESRSCSPDGRYLRLASCARQGFLKRSDVLCCQCTCKEKWNLYRIDEIFPGHMHVNINVNFIAFSCNFVPWTSGFRPLRDWPSEIILDNPFAAFDLTGFLIIQGLWPDALSDNPVRPP